MILGAYLADSREKAMDTVYAHTTRLRPDAPLDSYTLAGTPEEIHHTIQQYRTAGISKFVLRLACSEEEGLEQLARLAEAVAVPVNTEAYR